MEIIDSHLHIGNLSDTEFVTPKQVREQLTAWGVTGGLVMPIAMRGGGDDWAKHKALYTSASNIGFDMALYVNTDMLRQSPDLSDYLLFSFKALKIHPDAVSFSTREIHQICDIATSLNLPLMIHTGADECCHAGRFEPLIQQYQDLKFVLCHARPSKEAFPLLAKYPNAWIDTAFLPFHDLSANLTSKIEDRILFGTDFPANRWFPHLGNEQKWYSKQISNITNKFPDKTVKKIMYDNYCRIF